MKRGLGHPAILAAGALLAVEEEKARLSIPNDLFLVRSLYSQFAVLSQMNGLCDHYNMRHIQRCFASDDPAPVGRDAGATPHPSAGRGVRDLSSL